VGPSTDNDTPGRTKGRRDVWLYGTDLTLVRRDPTGGFNQPAFPGGSDIRPHAGKDDSGMASSWGAYVLAQAAVGQGLVHGGAFFDGRRMPMTTTGASGGLAVPDVVLERISAFPRGISIPGAQ